MIYSFSIILSVSNSKILDGSRVWRVRKSRKKSHLNDKRMGACAQISYLISYNSRVIIANYYLHPQQRNSEYILFFFVALRTIELNYTQFYDTAQNTRTGRRTESFNQSGPVSAGRIGRDNLVLIISPSRCSVQCAFNQRQSVKAACTTRWWWWLGAAMQRNTMTSSAVRCRLSSFNY